MNTLRSLAANQVSTIPFLAHASQSHIIISGSDTNPPRVSILSARQYTNQNSIRVPAIEYERFDSLMATLYATHSRPFYGIHPTNFTPSQSAYIVSVAQSAYGDQIHPGSFRLQLQSDNTPQLTAADSFSVGVQTNLNTWAVTTTGSIHWTGYEYGGSANQWVIQSSDVVQSTVTNNTEIARTNVTVDHSIRFRWEWDVYKSATDGTVTSYLATYVPVSTASNAGYLRAGVSRVSGSTTSWQIQYVDATGSVNDLITPIVDTWALSSGKRVAVELSGSQIILYKSDYQTGLNESTVSTVAIPDALISGSQSMKLGILETGTSAAKFEFLNPRYYLFKDANLDIVDDTYGNLVVSQSGTGSYVGNIAYASGLAVVQQISHSYDVINTSGMKLFSGSVSTVNFSSTVLIRENKITVKLYPNEYNISLFNQTARQPVSSGSATGSRGIELMMSKSLSPYITTIGLYNDANELLVMAKLSTPIKRTLDTIQSFIIRYDT